MIERRGWHTEVNRHTLLDTVGSLPRRVGATADAKRALLLGDDLGNA